MGLFAQVSFLKVRNRVWRPDRVRKLFAGTGSRGPGTPSPQPASRTLPHTQKALGTLLPAGSCPLHRPEADRKVSCAQG